MSASTARRSETRRPAAASTGTPLFAQVRDELRGLILRGELAAGVRLPSESELIDRFGVSRITVRQALGELQSAGLIATVNGKGSFVTRPDRASANGPLVGVLEAMRKRGLSARGRLVSQRIVPAPQTVARALQIPQRQPIGAVTVLRYLEGQPFVIGTTYVEPALAARLAAQDLENTDVTIALEAGLGVRIAETRVSVSALAAERGVARRLHCEPGAPVLRIRTVGYDYDHQPVTCSQTDCRGDLMDYRVTLRR